MFLSNCLGILVTGQCNKNCKYCVFGDTRHEFKFDMDMYELIYSKFKDKKHTEIILGGGEPLMYDGISDLIDRIFDDFKVEHILFRTNGKLLPEFRHKDNEKVCLEISEYPGWNDDVVADFKHRKNVTIFPFHGFTDCDKLELLSEADAREKYEKCVKFVWIKDGRVFECCYGIISEMKYNLEGASIPLSEWEHHKISELQTWKVCQSCLKCRDIFESQQEESHW